MLIPLRWATQTWMPLWHRSQRLENTSERSVSSSAALLTVLTCCAPSRPTNAPSYRLILRSITSSPATRTLLTTRPSAAGNFSTPYLVVRTGHCEAGSGDLRPDLQGAGRAAGRFTVSRRQDRERARRRERGTAGHPLSQYSNAAARSGGAGTRFLVAPGGLECLRSRFESVWCSRKFNSTN